MLAPTDTATKRAKPWAKDAATRPAGVVEPSFVSLSAIRQLIHQTRSTVDIVRGEEMKLTESHPGALAGEDEDERGDELREGGFDRVGMARLAGRSDCYATDRHILLQQRVLTWRSLC